MRPFLSIRPASAKSVFHARCCPHANRITTDMRGPAGMHAGQPFLAGAAGGGQALHLLHGVFESQGLALQ